MSGAAAAARRTAVHNARVQMLATALNNRIRPVSAAWTNSDSIMDTD